jgi:hypothetical protein
MWKPSDRKRPVLTKYFRGFFRRSWKLLLWHLKVTKKLPFLMISEKLFLQTLHHWSTHDFKLWQELYIPE